MKIDVTGGEASSIPTKWPAAVTFPRCAQIADQRSGRWHTTDGADRLEARPPWHFLVKIYTDILSPRDATP